MLERAAPRQRALFGVPLPEHPYWTEETIAGMAARYPGMDMTPYLAAAHLSDRPVVEAREHLARVPPPQRWTTRTGVASTMGNLRAQVDQLFAHVPPVAAYWTGVFDLYEMTKAMSPRPESDDNDRLSWMS
jgi:hypothetical protein